MQSMPVTLLNLTFPPMLFWLLLKWKIKKRKEQHSILALKITLTLCILYSFFLAYSLHGETESEAMIRPSMAVALYLWQGPIMFRKRR